MADFFRQAPRRYPLISILIAILVLIFLLWKVPQWQIADYDLSLKDRLHQENENRKTVAQIVGGVFVLFGLYIAWVRSKAMRDQAEVDREQQLTDLYVKAIEQLGSENLQIRLGGIYALERIARESPKDHWPIMEVLTAFVRESNPRRYEDQSEPQIEDDDIPLPPPSKPTTDIQAVLTVLGRTAIPFAKEGEMRSLDLRATDLAGANLDNANLKGADLQEANFQGADLYEANLQNANLSATNFKNARFWEANLQGAFLRGAYLQRATLREVNLQEASLEEANLQNAELVYANLQGAILQDANLQGAILQDANLYGAILQEAILQGANLEGANLQGTILWGANLQGADLEGTNLQGAHFQGFDVLNIKGADLRETKGLTAEQVAEAFWDETTKWPEGFTPPAPRRNPPQPRKEEKQEGK